MWECLLCVCSEGKAECVKDLPALGGSLQDWKPGLYYGVDDQCRIAFGSSARACSFTNADLVSHGMIGRCQGHQGALTLSSFFIISRLVALCPVTLTLTMTARANVS